MPRPKAHEMHSHDATDNFDGGEAAAGAAILVYLVFKGRDAFAQLSAETIDWPMLVAALCCTLVMAGLSYVAVAHLDSRSSESMHG